MFQWEFDILHFTSSLTASVCVCVGGWRDRAPTSFISALLSPSLPVLIREPARQVLRRQVLRLTWSKWVGVPDCLGDTGQVWGKKWEIWGATGLLEGLHLWHLLSKERIGRSWAEKKQTGLDWSTTLCLHFERQKRRDQKPESRISLWGLSAWKNLLKEGKGAGFPSFRSTISYAKKAHN